MYYRYDVDKLEMYKKVLTDPHATELHHDFLSSIVNYHGTDIDFIYSKFDKYMCYTLDASFSKKYSRPNNKFPVNQLMPGMIKNVKKPRHYFMGFTNVKN